MPLGARLLIGIVFCLWGLSAAAQTDTVQAAPNTPRVIGAAPDTSTTSVTQRRFSPRRAMFLSAILPGAGQAYNKKYWKIPIIYVGFGVLGYFIQDNYKSYIIFRDAFIAKQKYNVYILDRYYPNVDPSRLNDLDVMRRNRSYFRRNFEFSIVLSGVLYALNIIDANVDAHLKGFRLLNNDLSLVPQLPGNQLPAGLALRLMLK